MANGSLLLEDAPVWTGAGLDRLRVKFIDAPDEGERSFREKFADQLNDESQAVKRLAAEALAVYFLFPSNVHAQKKTRTGRRSAQLGRRCPPRRPRRH